MGQCLKEPKLGMASFVFGLSACLDATVQVCDAVYSVDNLIDAKAPCQNQQGNQVRISLLTVGFWGLHTT